MRPSVVLPQPLSPTRPTTWRGDTMKSTPSTARILTAGSHGSMDCLMKCFLSPRTSSDENGTVVTPASAIGSTGASSDGDNGTLLRWRRGSDPARGNVLGFTQCEVGSLAQAAIGGP